MALANAPISERAAFAYTAALNRLLQRDGGNRVRIGDATTVFWTETQAAEAVVRGFLDPPPPDDESEAAKVRDVLHKIEMGRPLKDAAPGVDEGTRYYVLGLSPNAARISVRFWHRDTLGELAERFREHWLDLAIEPRPRLWRGTAPALRQLLYETAVQRKAENIPPKLGGELMRSILTGDRYPRALLAAVIMRMRADRRVNGARAALCKACLVRDLRKERSFEQEDLLVSLNRDGPNPAYRLGRLFAVLESVQSAALGETNATIRDRYYGAASASPAAVFPLLIRGSRNHLANLRKGRGAPWVKKPENAAVWYEREMGQIIDGLGAELPRSFAIDDQGRFAVGYYHQRFSPKKGAPNDVEVADAAEPAEQDEA